MSLFGDWCDITFKYLLEINPQELGDVKRWDIYQPLYECPLPLGVGWPPVALVTYRDDSC